MGSSLEEQCGSGGGVVVGCGGGLPILLKDLKSLQKEGNNSGDLKFSLKDNHCMRAHSLIINLRCKKFTGNLKYEHVTPEIFGHFLNYVYTAELKVDKPLALYSLYLLSLDFGVDDLSTTCEEAIVSNLNHSSALQILQESVSYVEKEGVPRTTTPTSGGNGSGSCAVKFAIKKFTNPPKKEEDGKGSKIQKMVDTCITHLSENNASSLKKNPNFLSLPVETVKMMLSSEHFCLEEEEVWRCVLKWAQHKAAVTPHVSKWTEEERLKVSEFLHPVISYVKLLLIDSRVFAEEVEPTGCVPMALSLERYRTAALSTFEEDQRGRFIGDPRLVKRNSQKLFHSSVIITNERVALGKSLQEWYQHQHQHTSGGGDGAHNANTNWKLVYRASQHGFGAEDFHCRVDGLGQSYVVVLLKNSNWICGGYTDVPWASAKTPKFVSSQKSFLFALNPTTNGAPVQFNVVKKHFAVCHDANSGPIFGAGADLYLSSMCGSNAESYSNLPHSYEQVEAGAVPSLGDHTHQSQLRRQDKPNFLEENCLLSPSYNFTVADYEVFVPILP